MYITGTPVGTPTGLMAACARVRARARSVRVPNSPI